MAAVIIIIIIFFVLYFFGGKILEYIFEQLDKIITPILKWVNKILENQLVVWIIVMSIFLLPLFVGRFIGNLIIK